MLTVVLLVAVLTPLAATGAASLAGARVALTARICVAATAVATIAAAVALGATVTADDGNPSVGLELPTAAMLGVDRATAMLLVAVVGTGLVVASFSRRSLDAGHHRTRGYFTALAAVVTGSALVVLPGGPMPLVVGWLVSGHALLHLAGGWVDSTGARRAHRRARATVIVGDVALVAGVAIAVAVAGPAAVAAPADTIGELTSASLAGIGGHVFVAVAVLVAGASRSALVPFHRWLTATLYAPTPVSALVHAGFVSGAGLLLIRFAVPFVRADVAVVAAMALATATIALGVGAALTRPDAKGALAWSTVAQMAFMVLQCAVGAFAGAVFHIIGHGMYKAALFLGVGDTVAATLRSRRAPRRSTPLGVGVHAAAAAAIATGAVALGLVVGPTGLQTGEWLVLVVFAWLALAAGAHGALGTTSLGRGAAATIAVAGAALAAVAYFAGLAATKRFLAPSFETVEPDTTVTTIGAIVAVTVLAALAASVVAPGTSASAWRSGLRHRVQHWTEVRAPLDLSSVTPASSTAPPAHRHAEAPNGDDRVQVAELQAKVARAVEIVAPMWPLASFVAVNPLGGLERQSFDDATAEARRWSRGRTHRTLDQFRADHERGLSTSDDLVYAAHELAMVACSQPPVELPGRAIDAVEVVLADLLHGPCAATVPEPRTALERRFGPDAGDLVGIDDLVGEWVAGHLAPPTWPLEVPPDAGRHAFIATARRDAIAVARRHLDERAVTWLESLPDSSSQILAAAFEAAQIRPTDHVDELRGHFASVAGWAGLARWRTDWAHTDEPLPALRPIDIAAARAMLEAAVLIAAGVAPDVAPAAGNRTGEDLEARVTSAASHLGLASEPAARDAVRTILSLVPESVRASIWLAAQERRYEHRLLAALERTAARAAPAGDRPEAQVAFCIDVRSEGLRRRLEELGHDDTLGFAGFFGVPMAVRELGWPTAEARCPVLVAPSAAALEQPLVEHLTDAARRVARAGAIESLSDAHGATKHVPGATFAAAESIGWFAGARAAWHTLLAPRPVRPDVPTTTVRIGDEVGIEQRVLAAEAVLRTMGLVDGFAPLVVLCGHTSAVVNNAHGTALECGACAGASGASNARAVAALLNESDVRTGLAATGIEIPDETWFVGAVHDTASDIVTILDRRVAPASHHRAIDELQARLDLAGRRQAAERSIELPGATDDGVRARGRDWAQVRPEWGLATNAAFVVAPRSTTASLDLHGRAFLHSYDASRDPDGSILEAIMTAPLVVGHWISSQYYFSTVDPEVYGAGDKLLHNPIDAVGVITGAGGQLRVGLPLQSTHVDDDAHHQPLRLLAVIEADIARIESIIARNEVLSRLVDGGWLRVAARSASGEPWSTRTPGGTWQQLPRGARIETPTPDDTYELH